MSTEPGDACATAQQKQDMLLTHVILPRFLPQEISHHLDQTDLQLLHGMVDNVENLSGMVPPQTVKLFKSLRKIHQRIELNVDTISNEINALRAGDSFAIFVRRQRWMFIIYAPPCDDKNAANSEPQEVIVASFPGNVRPGEIYKHESDIELNYPFNAMKVKFSKMLRSKAFAHQLCDLYSTPPVESDKSAKSRDLVSKGLMTVLCDDESRVATSDEFPVITKKIRDEVLCQTEKSYFRRSYTYMGIKVLLQHNLTIQCGSESGKLLYKILMLKYLIKISGFYTSSSCATFNIDLLSELIAKMARRIEKLDNLVGEQAINSDFMELYEATVQESKDVIAQIRAKIDKQIKATIATETNLPPLTDLKFGECIKQKMRKLVEYMRKRSKNVATQQNTRTNNQISSYQRFFIDEKPPQINAIDIKKGEQEERVFWLDFENTVLYNTEKDYHRWSDDALRTWAFAYGKFAESKYKDNPLLISRMILVRLKIISILDRYATVAHPLLLQHQSGIEPKIIESLLLPQRIDMKIAYDLEKYFGDRNRNALQTNPSLIGERTASERSFSTKYAQQNRDMCELRKRILETDASNLEQKRTQWLECRREAEGLRRQASNLPCKCYNSSYNCRIVCEKCGLITRADQMKITQYEHLLPDNDSQQYAIVFELLIPNEIACLRDVLYDFTKYYHKESEKKEIKFKWTENRYDISKHNQSTSARVWLGSITKFDPLNIQIKNAFDGFHVKNSSDCIFYGLGDKNEKTVEEKKILLSSFKGDALKDACTLRTTPGSEYECLQWTLESTCHFQNDVLALQSDCPKNLLLSEFKNFGSLRADGHRLQHRKLYAMIATEALSFDKESVLSLVMQTLWECGISGDSAGIREAHEDFNDPKFCHEFIRLLMNFASDQENNWKDPFKMIIAVLIAVRIFEINAVASVADEIVELLNTVRFILVQWIDKIGTAIRCMEKPAEEKKLEKDEEPEEKERELRLKLIYVGVAGALTFSIYPKHEYCDRIFDVGDRKDNVTASSLWLRFVITVKNNLLMYNSNEDTLPPNLRMFIRLIESVGVNLECTIKKRIEEHPVAIHDLIRNQWTRAHDATFRTIQFHVKFPHILTIETVLGMDVQMVSIDVITGSFLVDGESLCHLPPEIMESEVYQWFFADVAFEVQPDAQKNYSAVQKYNGNSYEFKEVTADEKKHSVRITERTAAGIEKELIHWSVFKDDFPYVLTNDYSHWWIKSENQSNYVELNDDHRRWYDKFKNCIEFRKRTLGRVHFPKETTVDYVLDLDEQLLYHVQTERCMLDIGSESYTKIVQQLQRLEHPNFIQIFTQLDSLWLAEVELVGTSDRIGMNLKFFVDTSKAENQHHQLESNEFSGMRVSQTQNIGTLYGLNHGLILENGEDAQNRILLIPNGNVISERTQSHVSVHIDRQNKLNKPPFFKYQVDTILKQIKSDNGSFTSWFYLAYLHAVTSHGQIEEFTGMTGTERAIKILQSSFSGSSAPYEEDAIEMLRKIAKLSPCRKFTVEMNFQMVKWPEYIQPCAAQDCFVLIAKKLFDDSQRLHRLHPKKEKKIEKPNRSENEKRAKKFKGIETNFELNERDHRRCQQFYPNLNVSDKFIDHKEQRTSLLTPNQIGSSFSANAQKISILYHRQKYCVPSTLNLKSILKRDRTLNGFASQKCISSLLNHNEYVNLKDAWISLYEAVRKQEFNDEELALILILIYAHRGENIDLILSLQAIAMNRDKFEDINPPIVDTYNISHGAYVDERKLTEICEENYKTPDDYWNYDWAKRRDHENEKREICVDLAKWVTLKWPCDSVYLYGYRSYLDIHYTQANDAIDAMLLSWNNNRRLDDFLNKVNKRLKSLPASEFNSKFPDNMLPVCAAKNWPKFSIHFERSITEQLDTFDADIINEATNVWQNNASVSNKSVDHWWKIIQNITNPDKSQHLINAGLFPRSVPSLLLPKICQTTGVDIRLQNVIGAWAMAIAQEQWTKRIDNENKPHGNWKPCAYPEWLLFQIEQNLTIRRIQVKVANRMIKPPKMENTYAKHSAMQLNMGEGKSSVIVPILASVLSDSKQICQIIVLKSLYASNLNSIRQYLGGLLNRRIYTFPCRRDMTIDMDTIAQISNIYEECMVEKGVILTLPEYLLSFQLKMYESIQKKDYAMANGIWNILKMMKKNVRNILDESDAILQPKYQLIYPVGAVMNPDGGALRWTIAQAVLKRVPGHMKQLLVKHGEKKIEFDVKYIDNGNVFGAPTVSYRSDVFTPCRILDETMFEHLKSSLMNDFLEGRLDIDFPAFTDAIKNDLKLLLTQKELNSDAFQVIEDFSTNEKNTVYILSGLLRFEVLKLALTKRWRVNYGVDVNGRRKMAIPFRAKDNPAENSEFGHPDVAVLLTLMSYYYSGLNDAQLLEVFKILSNTSDAKVIYDKWIANIDQKLINLNTSVKSYSGVNLADPHQRDNVLYPLLRFNMDVIDFWLSNIVFPRELKMFDHKLTCTAWDLCSDEFEHLVTGFSGTNDTKNILPLSIAQNDLPELEDTNERMRQVLLRDENRSYTALAANISDIEILKQLIECEIPVLLDAGAIIKLDNKQLAMKWLKLAHELAPQRCQFDAALYFDSDDVRQTIDSNGIVTAYDCSVYRDNLSRCLVYLDEVHTRGTDLKFPLEWKAFVTLCGDQTRDKTIQACMRMRRLGNGHSISFFASFEADVRIRKLCKLSAENQVTNENVNEFIEENSRRYVWENMTHWIAAGLNHTKKLIGHKLLGNSTDEKSMNDLYQWCVENDSLTLAEMYGEKQEALLKDIIESKMNKLASNAKMTDEIRGFVNEIKRKMIEKLDEVKRQMVDKLGNQAPDLKKFTHSLDEEQEKELEPEQQDQREVQRPDKSEAKKPSYDKRLEKLVANGFNDGLVEDLKTDGVLMTIPNSLSHTKLYEQIEKDVNAWSDHLLVTKDFKTVINTTIKCDQFLRPVWWFAYIKNPKATGKYLLILLSTFECERLKSTFQKSTMAVLMMYRPRISKLHSNLIEIPALHITGMTESEDNRKLNLMDEIQIGIYSGMMYFHRENELKAYCEFLGLILRPHTEEQERAFDKGIIQRLGFVSPEHRQYSQAIAECVGQCKFKKDPVDFVKELIQVLHQTLPRDVHVAWILRGIKPDLAFGEDI